MLLLPNISARHFVKGFKFDLSLAFCQLLIKGTFVELEAWNLSGHNLITDKAFLRIFYPATQYFGFRSGLVRFVSIMVPVLLNELLDLILIQSTHFHE